MPGALKPDSGVSDTRGPCISARPVAPTFIGNLNKGEGGGLECSFYQEGCGEARELHGALNHIIQEEKTKESKGRRLGTTRQFIIIIFLSPDLYDLKSTAFATQVKKQAYSYSFLL